MPSTSVYISAAHCSFAAIATAVVSDPPRPKVVISPNSFKPWKPATTAIFPWLKCFSMFVVSISSILFFVCNPPVFIPAWNPVNATASNPFSFKIIVSRAIDTCSPVDMSKSISLFDGYFAACLAISNKWLVVLPIADNTTTTFWKDSFFLMILFAIFCIFSMVSTDDPPNFITTELFIFYFPSLKSFLIKSSYVSFLTTSLDFPFAVNTTAGFSSLL